MKFCEAITFESTPAGVIFTGKEWPAEIVVERGLIEYPQGPHVQFGRRGSLQFAALNGAASYRRTEDVMNGWRYVRTDAVLKGAAPTAAQKPAASSQPVEAWRYRNRKTGAKVEAFQWLPYAVPALPIPQWLMRADFEQNKDGILLIRSRGAAPIRVEPSDWLIYAGGKIARAGAAAFAADYDADQPASVAA